MRSSAGRLPLEDLRPYILDEPAAPIDWAAAFGSVAPVEIEVGFGKGLYLVTAGQARPEHHFLGIENVRALQLLAATRLAKRAMRHVKVMRADAGAVLRRFVTAGSVRAVHVYFPDPWWKTRHHKRRVFTAEFAAAAAAALEVGGMLHLATDVPAYFEVMAALAAARPELREVSRRREEGPPRPGEVLTNFERKARLAGVAVQRAEFKKAD